MSTMMTDIDPFRAEIMRLENEPYFNQRAWAAVLIALSGQPCRRADAARRMQTARANAIGFIGVDWGSKPDVTMTWESTVAVETEVAL